MQDAERRAVAAPAIPRPQPAARAGRLHLRVRAPAASLPEPPLPMSHPSSNLPRLTGYPASMFAIWSGATADPRTRGRRSMTFGIAASVLLHAGLLFLTLQHKLDMSAPPGGGAQEQITVRLTAPAAPRVAPPHPQEPATATAPPPRKRARVLTSPNAKGPAVAREEETPQPPARPAPPLSEPIDMADMIRAARERRQRAEEAAARENADAAAAQRGPSAQDIAMDNIRRSAQQGKRDGTGGVFQILHKGVRTATFAFRGWTPGARNSIYQTFEVDAGLGGNVELAIVRRMIELIRTHYSGDFNWESHRLGRIVVKSARPEHTAELEAFLMREFFGEDIAARPQ